MICPACGRDISTHRSRFGDECYNTHYLAIFGDDPKGELAKDYAAGFVYSVATVSKIPCPMSGQAVEGDK